MQSADLIRKTLKEEPIEKGCAVYFIFLSWGIGMLMIASGISTMLDYFKYACGNYFLDPASSFSFAGLAPQVIT